MASLFTNPLQALMGESNKAQSGPLASAEEAKANANLDADDSAWVFVGDDIDGTRWNKVYPYQLIIVEKTASGYANTGKVFTLPIPPTDMQISTPFAITTSVTLGGIVEEHNGAPLRQIQFSGTTGVVPLKGSGEILSQANIFQGVFAGTLNAAANVVSNAKTLVGISNTASNLVSQSDEDGSQGHRLLPVQAAPEVPRVLRCREAGRRLGAEARPGHLEGPEHLPGHTPGLHGATDRPEPLGVPVQPGLQGLAANHPGHRPGELPGLQAGHPRPQRLRAAPEPPPGCSAGPGDQPGRAPGSPGRHREAPPGAAPGGHTLLQGRPRGGRDRSRPALQHRLDLPEGRRGGLALHVRASGPGA
jgi:hypothetical protein